MLQAPCVCRSPQFYVFLQNNLVDVMLNPLRKKRVRVDAIPKLLLMKINSLRSRCHALKLENIKYLDMVVALCMLFTLFEYDQWWISKPQPFILIISIQYFISFHSQYLFREFSLNIIYTNPRGNDLVFTVYTIVLILCTCE